MTELPGWLLKRARDLGAPRAHVILEPAKAHSTAMYLLETADGRLEFHVVDDAESGVDGVTIPMNRSEAAIALGRLAGALSGRRQPIEIRPLPPLPAVPAPSVPEEVKP